MDRACVCGRRRQRSFSWPPASVHGMSGRAIFDIDLCKIESRPVEGRSWADLSLFAEHACFEDADLLDATGVAECSERRIAVMASRIDFAIDSKLADAAIDAL